MGEIIYEWNSLTIIGKMFVILGPAVIAFLIFKWRL